MAKSQSYEEWYGYAEDLDRSQKRDVWIRRIKDQTSFHYNWSFVQDLIRDLRNAREQGDSILALAVIQQCTRKNVGGIMSEDLFSYTNTGEPKAVVREFIEEAVQTLHWLTDEALHIPVDDSAQQQSNEKRTYEEQMEETVQAEKDKIWKSLTNLFGNGEDGKQNDDVKTKDGNETHSPESAPHQDIESRTDNPLPSFHRQEVLTFLKRARAAYGRTALCLSGGAMMGVYHFGHVRALLETGSLPNIVRTGIVFLDHTLVTNRKLCIYVRQRLMFVCFFFVKRFQELAQEALLVRFCAPGRTMNWIVIYAQKF
jgi:hypothetical protein